MKRPYRDFDLPTEHITAEQHYIPPRARSSDEIERRHGRPRGVLLAEQQLRGVQAATFVLDRIDDKPEEIRFVSNIIAASGLNTAWYSYARGSNVMRRRLHLPTVPIATLGEYPERTAMVDAATYELDEAKVTAIGLIRAIENNSPTINQRRRKFGQRIGNASLTLAAAALGEAPFYTNPATAQTMAREQAMTALDTARSMSDTIGTPPSIAQLADPDSDLSVFIRRQAPDGIYDAFEEAVEIYRIPR